MKIKAFFTPIVIHSLVWAAMMLITAWLSGDAGNMNQQIIFMIGGWFISNQLLINALKSNDNEGNDKCSTRC